MQLWRASRGQCLLCAFRPVSGVMGRSFTTTSPLDRSASKAKKKKAQANAEAKQTAIDLRFTYSNSKQEKRPMTKSALARRERHSVVGSDRFVSVIETSLLNLNRTLEISKDQEQLWEEFKEFVVEACDQEPLSALESVDPTALALKRRLQQVYLNSGPTELIKALRSEYRTFVFDRIYTSNVDEQKKMADFRYPAEWYPIARTLQRKIHLHVGPTNSGKTYHALQRLEAAKTGFYAGPLRLLAHEVYGRLTGKGISCGLITGDEVKVPENDVPSIFSNTVEMVPIGQEVEVGVIDEIQMIGDPQRGWAWSRALLGSRAHELHLCGEERVVPLIRELAASMGDKLEIHRYQRLNPLRAMTKSLKGDFKKLQKGDCVVAFSRLAIHALKQEIERVTGRRCAIVYGSLPAEIRSQQTDLFNDPNNDYDFLVASDAIGMGLNLSCKRIIFETVIKKMPTGLQRLSISQIKQIGGRAGRYRSAAQSSDTNNTTPTKHAGPKNAPSESDNVGYVTSLEDIDLPFIQEALKSEAPAISGAGILPPDHVVRQFSDHFPRETPFSYVLQRLQNITQTSPHYFLCEMKDQCATSEVIDNIKGLTVSDKLIFTAAPTSIRDPASQAIVRAFARCVAENKGGRLLDIPELNLEILNQPVSDNKEYLRSLETLHRALVLYLWLSYRCGGVFTDRVMATHAKELVERNMDRALTEFSANSKLRKASSFRRQVELLRQMEEREKQYENQQASEGQDSPGGITMREWENAADEVLEKAADKAKASASTH